MTAEGLGLILLSQACLVAGQLALKAGMGRTHDRPRPTARIVAFLALGIALLGSIANSAYRSDIELGGVSLPAPAREGAGESIGAANAIAERVPGGADVATRAASAFADAFTLTNAVALGIALAAAVAVLAFSRRDRREPGLDDEAVEVYDLDLVTAGAVDVGD